MEKKQRTALVAIIVLTIISTGGYIIWKKKHPEVVKTQPKMRPGETTPQIRPDAPYYRSIFGNSTKPTPIRSRVITNSSASIGFNPM